MQKEKQNGITLIALIITIIVMLILVAVTVAVALNGGLFTTAEDAGSKTQIEAEKEKLLSVAIGAMGENGEVDFAVLDTNLPEEFTGSNGTYTSATGNKYTVSKAGNVDENSAVLNEYGFYYNKEYKCENLELPIIYLPTISYLTLLDDNSAIIRLHQDDVCSEGSYQRFRDMTGSVIMEIESLEYDKDYFSNDGLYIVRYNSVNNMIEITMIMPSGAIDCSQAGKVNIANLFSLDIIENGEKLSLESNIFTVIK